jgi:hypothetical protein
VVKPIINGTIMGELWDDYRDDYRYYYWDNDLDYHMIGDNSPKHNPNNNHVIIPNNILTIILNYPQVSTI